MGKSYIIDGDKLTTLGDVVRGITNNSNKMTVDQMIETLSNLSASGSSGEAIEVETSEEMDALLVAENIGLVYKYTGVTNENYTYGKLYTIEEV